MLEGLKYEVLEANRSLVKHGLVLLTWGNVSGIDRKNGLIVIKPSGVEYEKLSTSDMVVVDLDGNVVEGSLRPSSDTPTHIRLYRAFKSLGGITHTHSTNATAFAQAGKEIPCFGTTHADAFFGRVPVTRQLTKSEVHDSYESNTGKVIIERFRKLDPVSMPAVLVAGHGPFCWGINAQDSVNNSAILERISEIAIKTLALNRQAQEIRNYLLTKHHDRKHGNDAYYGQKK